MGRVELWINHLHDILKRADHGVKRMTANHEGFIPHDKFAHAYQLGCRRARPDAAHRMLIHLQWNVKARMRSVTAIKQ
jgi:hypothetical protein